MVGIKKIFQYWSEANKNVEKRPNVVQPFHLWLNNDNSTLYICNLHITKTSIAPTLGFTF